MWSYMAIAAVLAVAGIAFALYRAWHLRWGASDEELSRRMPGDEVVGKATFNATRAVTIKASPEDIWPWIVQIGFGRAGWYSYDLLDNLGRHSSERVIPELQHIEVGALIPMGPGAESGLWVKGFVSNRWILWSDRNGDSTWAWGLYANGSGGTRLVTRVRMHYLWSSPAILFNLLLVEPWDFPMMRKCMVGIRRRAEALARQRRQPVRTSGLVASD